MRRRSLFLPPSTPVFALLVLLLAGCGKGETPVTDTSIEPHPDAVQTLMLTYETVIMPDNRTVRFQVASDGNLVRLGNETETWRLFDTRNRTITFVDQTAGTATVVSFDDAVAEMNRKLAGVEVPTEGAPTVSVVEGPGEPQKGHPTHRVFVEFGSFSRELLLSKDLLLPGEFFAMKVATDPHDARYASIMKDILPVLVRQNGTLLSETNRLDLPDGEPVSATTKLVSVTTIQLSKKAFALPDNITVTTKSSEATSGAATPGE